MKPLFTNERGTYALVNKQGKVIAKFRLMAAAEIMKSKFEHKLFEELEIVRLKK